MDLVMILRVVRKWWWLALVTIALNSDKSGFFVYSTDLTHSQSQLQPRFFNIPQLFHVLLQLSTNNTQYVLPQQQHQRLRRAYREVGAVISSSLTLRTVPEYFFLKNQPMKSEQRQIIIVFKNKTLSRFILPVIQTPRHVATKNDNTKNEKQLRVSVDVDGGGNVNGDEASLYRFPIDYELSQSKPKVGDAEQPAAQEEAEALSSLHQPSLPDAVFPPVPSPSAAPVESLKETSIIEVVKSDGDGRYINNLPPAPTPASSSPSPASSAANEEVIDDIICNDLSQLSQQNGHEQQAGGPREQETVVVSQENVPPPQPPSPAAPPEIPTNIVSEQLSNTQQSIVTNNHNENNDNDSESYTDQDNSDEPTLPVAVPASEVQSERIVTSGYEKINPKERTTDTTEKKEVQQQPIPNLLVREIPLTEQPGSGYSSQAIATPKLQLNDSPTPQSSYRTPQKVSKDRRLVPLTGTNSVAEEDDDDLIDTNAIHGEQDIKQDVMKEEQQPAEQLHSQPQSTQQPAALYTNDQATVKLQNNEIIDIDEIHGDQTNIKHNIMKEGQPAEKQHSQLQIVTQRQPAALYTNDPATAKLIKNTLSSDSSQLIIDVPSSSLLNGEKTDYQLILVRRGDNEARHKIQHHLRKSSSKVESDDEISKNIVYTRKKQQQRNIKRAPASGGHVFVPKNVPYLDSEAVPLLYNSNELPGNYQPFHELPPSYTQITTNITLNRRASVSPYGNTRKQEKPKNQQEAKNVLKSSTNSGGPVLFLRKPLRTAPTLSSAVNNTAGNNSSILLPSKVNLPREALKTQAFLARSVNLTRLVTALTPSSIQRNAENEQKNVSAVVLQDPSQQKGVAVEEEALLNFLVVDSIWGNSTNKNVTSVNSTFDQFFEQISTPDVANTTENGSAVKTTDTSLISNDTVLFLPFSVELSNATSSSALNITSFYGTEFQNGSSPLTSSSTPKPSTSTTLLPAKRPTTAKLKVEIHW